MYLEPVLDQSEYLSHIWDLTGVLEGDGWDGMDGGGHLAVWSWEHVESSL